MKWIIVALSFASLSAHAAFTCTVDEVLDGGSFENENDFTFADYPYVTYAPTSEYEETSPYQTCAFTIRESENRIGVSAKADEDPRVQMVTVFWQNSKTGVGLFSVYEKGNSTDIAILNCRQ
ncbi:MAG TPA: hypothetical protein PKC28_02230 [Bdellovibrionales bacterium]|nr:hypothetical protein [Bdellovibrionales bacterium]